MIQAEVKREGYSFVQLAVRMLVNAEALNMVESVGNVTRHRTIPVIYPKGPGRYHVRWVPAISGETFAHRYQEEIVALAKKHSGCKDRIDYWSERGEFLKHWDLDFYRSQCTSQQAPKPKPWECALANAYAGKQKLSLREIVDIEKKIVDNSVVEDIGGFLITQGPVKRTSCIRFSYAIPTMDSLDVSQVDHQMHVRGALQAQSLRIRGYEEAIQIPYYVQVGSALYGFNIELEVGRVGCYSNSEGRVETQDCDIVARRCIALYALRPILDGDFGAKRARNRPHNQLEITIAIASSKPIPMPPATLHFDNLIEELKEKLSAYARIGVDYKVYALIPPGLPYRDQLISKLNGIVKLANVDVKEMIVSTSIDLLSKLAKDIGLDCSWIEKA